MQLPSSVSAYIEATNARDAAGVARCFLPDGTVRDEGEAHRGSADIAAWAHETGQRYQATMTPRRVTGTGGQWLVEATVEGNFPGSPATLRFSFALQDERIAALEIGV